MSLFIFLTVVQAIVAALLVAVILMQKSEGGGLGVGSSSAGLMSARGAADFMTRATSVLATAFVVLSVILATLAVGATSTHKIDTSLSRTAPVAPDPLAGGAQTGPVQSAPPAATPAAPAAKPAPADPLSGAAKQ
ncbi:preprotein translocase subunit SecG [Novosphingobium sp.]|uniref:preprotein translocase subunit SecG n=1 Tax=Novosphingobium sp. TaxID=1874826 RepID=UPI0033429BF7